MERRRLTFLLDTGGAHTAAWPVFGQQFPVFLEKAGKGSEKLVGLSGSADVDATILPELPMTLAGVPLVQRPAPVLLSTTVPASNWHHRHGSAKTGEGSDA